MVLHLGIWRSPLKYVSIRCRFFRSIPYGTRTGTKVNRIAKKTKKENYWQFMNLNHGCHPIISNEVGSQHSAPGIQSSAGQSNQSHLLKMQRSWAHPTLKHWLHCSSTVQGRMEILGTTQQLLRRNWSRWQGVLCDVLVQTPSQQQQQRQCIYW